MRGHVTHVDPPPPAGYAVAFHMVFLPDTAWGGGDLAGAEFGTAERGTTKLYHILPWYLRSEATFFSVPVHIFSPLQGSEGLNCWGHHVFTLNTVSQVSSRESTQLSYRSTVPPNCKPPARFLHHPLFGTFVPHFSTVFKILYQIFPSPNFALPKYARTNAPPPPR